MKLKKIRYILLSDDDFEVTLKIEINDFEIKWKIYNSWTLILLLIHILN